MEPRSNLGISAYAIFQSLTPVLQLSLSSHGVPNSLAIVADGAIGKFYQVLFNLTLSHPTMAKTSSLSPASTPLTALDYLFRLGDRAGTPARVGKASQAVPFRLYGLIGPWHLTLA